MKNHMFCFDTTEALAINRERVEWMGKLNIDWSGKRVLETGCGPRGDITTFLESKGAHVIAFDARQDVLDEHARRFPSRKHRLFKIDFNEPDCLSGLGHFDICVCVGTLYHLGQPQNAIEEMAKNCDTLILGTHVVRQAQVGGVKISSSLDQWNIVGEDSATPNQAFDGVGCRPSPDFLRTVLLKYWPDVSDTTQPEHYEFTNGLRRCWVCRKAAL